MRTAPQPPAPGDLAHNSGMCPDWESNRWPFGYQASTQSTEPHQPGPNLYILNYWFQIGSYAIDKKHNHYIWMHAFGGITLKSPFKKSNHHAFYYIILNLEVIQGGVKVGLQLWVCETQSLFLYYLLLYYFPMGTM